MTTTTTASKLNPESAQGEKTPEEEKTPTRHSQTRRTASAAIETHQRLSGEFELAGRTSPYAIAKFRRLNGKQETKNPSQLQLQRRGTTPTRSLFLNGGGDSAAAAPANEDEEPPASAIHIRYGYGLKVLGT